jgi:3-hydroxyisobutyrate dehydrogenase-like beta-hydroxyacid dehydrogenase
MDRLSCGVVGVGVLGHGIATSLARAGLPVIVYDADPAAAEAAAAGPGIGVAPTVESLASESDVVLLVLPDTPEILEVADELALGVRTGSAVLVVSTVSPETPVELERRLRPLGVQVLDCPISGGPARAERGDLAVMVGGDAAAFGRLRPVWDAIGSLVVHVGPLGHGEIAKLANNLMGAVIVEAIAEGLTLAAKAGADVGRVVDAIAAGSGSSWILREWIPETVLRGDYARRFSLDLMRKDMRLVAELAGRLDVPIPACEVARDSFERAIAAGYGDDDFSRAIELHARAADTSI